MSELLAQIPNSTVAFEPLMRGRTITDGKMPVESKKGMEELGELGFYYYQPIPDEARWPEAYDVFHRLFNRQNFPLSVYLGNYSPDLVTKNPYIFKFCYGNLLLPWVAANFEISNLFLVRHPCAVVASQMGHYAWKFAWKHPQFLLPEFRYDDVFRRYIAELARIKHPVENLAAMWALTVDAVVRNPKNDIAWRTVSYESLYLQPEKELQRIFDYLGQSVPNSVFQVLEQPSDSTVKGSESYIRSGRQLESWKEKLGAEKSRRVLDTVKALGVDYYDQGQEPDYTKIYKNY